MQESIVTAGTRSNVREGAWVVLDGEDKKKKSSSKTFGFGKHKPNVSDMNNGRWNKSLHRSSVDIVEIIGSHTGVLGIFDCRDVHRSLSSLLTQSHQQ